MTRQHGQFGIILGVGLVILVLAVIGLFAVCTPGENDHSFGKIQLVRYDDEQPRCYEDEDCYNDDDGGDGYSQRYDQNYGSRDDRNRNRHRNRGAFSPGPFDRSPLDFRNACISLDCSGRSNNDRDRRDDQPPPDEREER